jgi:glutamine synthetase
MSDALEDLKSRAETDGVEFFFAMFVDMHGKPCAKLVPVQALEVLLSGGAGFAGFAAGDIGQSPADPDLVAVPDPASYTPAPWQPGLAVLQCDVHVEGVPWPYSPRLILQRVLDTAKSRGIAYQVGCEAEYFLLRRGPDGRLLVADQADCLESPCYDAKALTRMYDHITRVSKYMNQFGWSNYANDHEDANGQFEQNFRYADALTTADRVVFFRYMVHTLAQQAGMTATFMPKPFSHLTGNGLHMHSSLWDEASGAELFVDASDPRGLGLSETAYYFIGGLLGHASSLAAVTCPNVNSYKRMGVGAPLSGATWAPAYVTYGGNNRTQMLRVSGGGSVENRACDGAANPYLAMAAQLAAGLDGIEHQADPGEPNLDNLYELSSEEIARRGIRTLPPTLLHAVEELTDDAVLRQALGKTANGDYVDYYASVKRREFLSWHASVTGSEIDRYLTLF